MNTLKLAVGATCRDAMLVQCLTHFCLSWFLKLASYGPSSSSIMTSQLHLIIPNLHLTWSSLTWVKGKFMLAFHRPNTIVCVQFYAEITETFTTNTYPFLLSLLLPISISSLPCCFLPCTFNSWTWVSWGKCAACVPSTWHRHGMTLNHKVESLSGYLWWQNYTGS